MWPAFEWPQAEDAGAAQERSLVSDQRNVWERCKEGIDVKHAAVSLWDIDENVADSPFK
jgi:hypothetical protein